jgi:hypothetical protein
MLLAIVCDPFADDHKRIVDRLRRGQNLKAARREIA